MSEIWDVIIVGAGSTGMPASIFAAGRGARVLQVEADNRVGGTLYWSSGQISAAGSRLQKSLGVDDTPQEHYDDAQRIAHGTIDPVLGRLAIDNAADTLDWLMDLGFQPLPGHPVAGSAHETYRIRRYCWGEKMGVSILDVIRPVHEKLAAQNKIDLRLSTRFRRLVQDRSGAVTGIEVETANGHAEIHHGRNIVLTTGGYAANPEMWREITPNIALNSYCNPYSRGDGIRAARDIGAAFGGEDRFLCTCAGFRENPDDPLSGVFYRLIPDMRMPWEIYVDARGKRFVREDHPSVDHIERALLAQPEMTMYIIFDEPIRQNAPVINLETREDLAARFGNHPYFLKARSLAALAEQLDMNAAALTETVEKYNAAVEARHDPEFGREHMIRPIAEPPFYAAKAVGATVVSPGGLAADGDLRVLKEDGSHIPNLYAGGEILGFGRISGNAFVGGMSLMPALTFGRLLGQKLLAWNEAPAVAE